MDPPPPPQLRKKPAWPSVEVILPRSLTQVRARHPHAVQQHPTQGTQPCKPSVSNRQGRALRVVGRLHDSMGCTISDAAVPFEMAGC